MEGTLSKQIENKKRSGFEVSIGFPLTYQTQENKFVFTLLVSKKKINK